MLFQMLQWVAKEKQLATRKRYYFDFTILFGDFAVHQQLLLAILSVVLFTTLQKSNMGGGGGDPPKMPISELIVNHVVLLSAVSVFFSSLYNVVVYILLCIKGTSSH